MTKKMITKRKYSKTWMFGLVASSIFAQLGAPLVWGQGAGLPNKRSEIMGAFSRMAENSNESLQPINHCPQPFRPLFLPRHSIGFLPRMLRAVSPNQASGVWANTIWINNGNDVLCPFVVTSNREGVVATPRPSLYDTSGYDEQVRIVHQQLGARLLNPLSRARSACATRFSGVASIEFRRDTQVPGAVTIIQNGVNAPGLPVPNVQCSQILRVNGLRAVAPNRRVPTRQVFRNGDQEPLSRYKSGPDEDVVPAPAE